MHIVLRICTAYTHIILAVTIATNSHVMSCAGVVVYFVHTAHDTTRLIWYGGHWRPLHVATT